MKPLNLRMCKQRAIYSKNKNGAGEIEITNEVYDGRRIKKFDIAPMHFVLLRRF